MVFSSNLFLYVFLPLFLICYCLARTVGAKNAVLLVFSIVFYAWGEPVFVLVLLLSVTINWIIGLKIAQGRRFALASGVGWNLALLGVSKYAGFAAEIFNVLSGAGIPVPDIALPLGVSFFSFQAISYMVDVARGRAQAERTWLRVALYITMFPQLVAGPIVRFSKVSHQLKQRHHTLMRVSLGLRVFAIGLAQKVLIANEVGHFADVAFSSVGLLDAGEAWGGLVAYTLQIYFDFAGYSNMAIGIGLMCAFSFPRNFRLPYSSRSITEFWRRWHMSLSRWFRDYLYIPLGGNRGGTIRTYANLVGVFALCGIWHGAAMNFLVWGLHHGAFLVIERMGFGSVLQRLPAFVSVAYTLLVVMSGWVWFRAETLAEAITFFAALAGAGGNDFLDEVFTEAVNSGWIAAMIAGTLLALVPGAMWRRVIGGASRTLSRLPLPGFIGAVNHELAIRDTLALGLLALALIFVAGSNYNPFLYFRF